MASKGRLAWLAIGVSTTVVALTASSAGVWFYTAYRPSAHDKTYTENYAWAAKTLGVQLSSGDLQVFQGPPGHVEIFRDLRWTRTKPSVTEHWNGRALDVAAQCPASGFGESCSVDYTITVPPGVSVTAVTDGGTIRADGMDGSLSLTTLSGDVFVTGARSTEVFASSDAGNVRLGFTAAPDSIQATTAAGDVRIEVPPGDSYAVHPTADSGNLRVEVSDDPSSRRSIVATSDSGNLTVVYG